MVATDKIKTAILLLVTICVLPNLVLGGSIIKPQFVITFSDHRTDGIADSKPAEDAVRVTLDGHVIYIWNSDNASEFVEVVVMALANLVINRIVIRNFNHTYIGSSMPGL